MNAAAAAHRPMACRDPQVLQVSALSLWRYTLPFRRPIGGLSHRVGFLLGLVSGDHQVFGEIAPWPGRAPLEERDLLTLLPGVAASFRARAMTLAPDALLPPELAAALGAWPAPLAHGVLGALWQLAAAESELPLCRWLRDDAPLAVQSAALLLEGEDPGALPPTARTIKVKVAHASDLQHLEAVRARFPAARLRVDGNRALDEAAARALMTGAAPLGVDFFEEPALPACLPALWGDGFPVALDESLEDDAVSAALWQDAHTLVLKPALLGPHKLLRALGAHGRLVLSSPFESAVGRALLGHLQAAFAPALDPGLGTARFLAEDLGAPEDAAGRLSLATPLVPDTARLPLLHREALA